MVTRDKISAFLSGYASSFDYLGGGRRTADIGLSDDWPSSDADRLQRDWESVGAAMTTALELYAQGGR